MEHRLYALLLRLSTALLALLLFATLAPAAVTGDDSPPDDIAQRIDEFVYLPVIFSTTRCTPVAGAGYSTIGTINPATGINMETHPDVNLAVRGYKITDAFKGLVTYGGDQDPKAPQLPWLFGDRRTPEFRNVYQVYSWDWERNRRGSVYTDPEVTLAGLATSPGEIIYVPDSGYDIGGGNDVMVLYASPTRLTLKYTREDNVIFGYTIHLENLCVEPRLLALYRASDAAGRIELPALTGGQPLGRAIGRAIGVVVRDTGAFMDPRSRRSWWIGR